jgi:hypothetical protein
MPDVMRITSESSNPAQAVNVWHFICPGAASTTLANEAITKIDTFFEAIKAHLAPDTWTHGRRVTTVNLTPNIVVPATSQTTLGTGTNRGPQQVAIVLSWQTAFIGKSYSGRSYIGPLSQLAIGTTGNTPSGSALSDIATNATALRTATTGGAQLAVWSEKLQVANACTSHSVTNLLRTQRRRVT